MINLTCTGLYKTASVIQDEFFLAKSSKIYSILAKRAEIILKACSIWLKCSKFLLKKYENAFSLLKLYQSPVRDLLLKQYKNFEANLMH